MKKSRVFLLERFLLLMISAPFAQATESPQAADNAVELTAIDVVTESSQKSDLLNASSSSAILTEKDLFSSHVFNVNEALRKVPGVYVRDEEGFGIRPNISFRGLNPFRSTKVLFLEDGLLLNFAPYGDNDIYYHPPIERYEGIEVFKGAELNLYGPQTINGAVNYLTPTPPAKPGGYVSFTGGNRDYLTGHVRYGGTVEKTGSLDAVGGIIDYLHKEGSGARDNTFVKLDDANLKGVIDFNAKNSLTLRGDYYQENSQSTFGITEAELRNFGYRYNPFRNDEFITERFSTSATHELRFNEDSKLSTSFYWSNFNRDFWRQLNQQPTDNQCGNAFREARLNGQAIDVDSCNFTRGRLRQYEAWGVEPRLHAKHDLFGVDSELDAGVRLHFESSERSTLDGNTSTARNGVAIENNNRFADAFSGFVQNRFILGDWTVTPGVRVESISYERENLPFEGNPALGIAGNTLRTVGKNDFNEVLPSFALTYQPISNTQLFFNMHRGFAPPRVEDSIFADGQSVEIGPEKSWNFELGVRSTPFAGIKTDLTYFHNDFEALTVLGTVGGNDSPVAQGEALFEGLEFSNRIDLADVFGWIHNPYLQIAYTWVPTAETLSPFKCLPQSDGTISPRCPNGNVLGSQAGNRSPYAPEHLLNAALGYSHPSGVDAHFEAVLTDEQFGDFFNLQSGADHPNGPNSIEARSGQFGKLEDYIVVNFSGTYKVHRGLNLYVSIKNMLDNQYIVDRVRGILTGSPRLVQTGFKYEF